MSEPTGVLSGDEQAEVSTSARPMDFVVGGIPRSGTTILSKILNGHEEVYSYSSETNIFRHVWLYARHEPLQKHREAEFRSYLKRDMSIRFVEHFEPYMESLQRYHALLRRHNPKVPETPILPLFTRQDIDRMHDGIMDLFLQGLWGAELCRASSSLLGELLRHRSGRDIVGEKTPDNIMSMDIITRGAPKSLFVCSVREPIPTIRSMMNRALGGGVQDRAFSARFLESVGHYHEYQQAILDAQKNTNRIELVRYEDLMDRPGPVIHDVLQKLGLAAEIPVRHVARALVGQAPVRPDAHTDFSAGEIRLAKSILGHGEEILGTDFDLEVTEGRPYGTHMALDKTSHGSLLPVSGFEKTAIKGLLSLLPKLKSGGARFSGKATLLLVHDGNATSAVIDLSCVSDVVDADNTASVRISVNHKASGEVNFVGACNLDGVEIDVSRQSPHWIDDKTFVHVIGLEFLQQGEARPPQTLEVSLSDVT